MEYFLLGLGLGAAAGLAPGPLHVLVLTTSMQRGLAAGTRVAIAPLLTDVCVVAAGVLAVGTLPEGVVRALAVGGGLFIIYLGIDALRWQESESAPATPAVDLRRGFITNLLNPHPWLFWLGVGGSLIGFPLLLEGLVAQSVWMTVLGIAVAAGGLLSDFWIARAARRTRSAV